MENIRIERIRETYFTVVADSERFGKDAVLYEGTCEGSCMDYLSRNNALKTYYSERKASFTTEGATKIKVPAKYRHMIEKVDYEGKDSGYWVYLNNGFLSENGHGSHTIHEYNQTDLFAQFEKIVSAIENYDKEKKLQKVENKVQPVLDRLDAQINIDPNSLNNLRIALSARIIEDVDKRTIKEVYIEKDKSLHFVFEEHSYTLQAWSYTVLSAYHNGIADRTTYNGLHRGNYDNRKLENAQNTAKKRADSSNSIIMF